MSVYDEELSRLLVLYRRGHISEEVLLAQMRDLEREAEQREAGEEAAPRTRAPRNDAVSRGRPNGTDNNAELASTVEMLDRFRAAEAAGARTLTEWAMRCGDPGLADGLRTAAAREERHAKLLEERLRELGAAPTADIPEWMVAYNAAIADPRASDLDRLASLIAQFPDVETAVVPLLRTIDATGEDRVTRQLLQTICDDEVATIEWIHRAYARLSQARGG